MKGERENLTLLWCLHGNLQQPSVWDDLALRLKGEGLELEAPDLWQTQATGFWDWAQTFCERVAVQKARHLLLGYSLGGRLALHALLQAPELWQGALLVGADTGLADAREKAARLAWDRAWGARFLYEDWQTVLQDWDAQAVFAGRPATAQRRDVTLSREAAARLFDVFSKGRQDDLLPRLVRLRRPPILYVSGEDDVKYTDLGERLERKVPALERIVIPGAAHRVPWEAPEAFASVVRAFLERV